MAGEEDLSTLIKSMSPSLEDEIFVFGHVAADSASGWQFVMNLLSEKSIQMILWEKEGWTLILPERLVSADPLQPIFPCKKITLNIHSSLDAVGFMAAITAKLTKLKIGVNPVSGYFHDHLFVSAGKEDAAMGALREMTKEINT